MPEESDRLTYLTVGEIREEIAYAVGADPGRFEAGSHRGLRRDTLRRIAEQLRPEDCGIDVQQCHLPELYETICEWIDVDYEHNAGNPWSLNKPQLKVIHRELGASDPREAPTIATDGSGETATNRCERCGDGEATAKITLGANYDGSMQSEYEICNACVRSLGELFEDDGLRADGGQPSAGTEQLDRAGDACYWCGGDVADGGSIRAQMREGEPKRETCPDCFRGWPPEQVEEEYMDEESSDSDE